MVRSLEQITMRKVYLRILPFAALTYFMCYLDRINVGFAALTMNKDIGLDAAIYGMAAGAFFWGYVLAEVPSNIILERYQVGRLTQVLVCPNYVFVLSVRQFQIQRQLVATLIDPPNQNRLNTQLFPDRFRIRTPPFIAKNGRTRFDVEAR